jgi:hypothetical protein
MEEAFAVHRDPGADFLGLGDGCRVKAAGAVGTDADPEIAA